MLRAQGSRASGGWFKGGRHTWNKKLATYGSKDPASLQHLCSLKSPSRLQDLENKIPRLIRFVPIRKNTPLIHPSNQRRAAQSYGRAEAAEGSVLEATSTDLQMFYSHRADEPSPESARIPGTFEGKS